MDADLYVVNVEAAVWREGRYLMVVRGAGEEIAPGTLTPPGGKVEGRGAAQDVLEQTLRREVREETGVEVEDAMAYVESHAFEAAGVTVVDVVMLARYRAGRERVDDDGEVAAVEWLTLDEILSDERAMPWTRETMRRADARRLELGW